MTTRQATPDILGAVLGGELQPAVQLRWDYSQAGEHAAAVQRHAANIKRAEAQATEQVIAAGAGLIAVKGLLAHGQWLDWLKVEFAMSESTALNLMRIAAAFGDKSAIITDLRPTVLGLIAAPSVPEPARQAVIDASANGQRVTVAQAKEIIAEYKPVMAIPAAALSAAMRTYAVNGPALPAWVEEDQGAEQESWQGEGDPALSASWLLTITARTDPAELGQALRGVVDAAWMERLWDGYMGAA